MDKRFLVQQAILAIICLNLVVVLFELTNIDMWLQSRFYQFDTGHWLLDKHNETLKLVFYDGPKNLLVGLLVLALLVLLVSIRSARLKPYRQGLVIVLLTTVVTVMLVGFLKAWTNVPCPKDLSGFGGSYPHITFLHRIPLLENMHRVRCFPAGHASGGFALLSLFFLFRSRRNQWIGFWIGMFLGWALGGYKMLIGDHFLSHTLVTMCLAWLLSVLIAAGVFWVSAKVARS